MKHKSKHHKKHKSSSSSSSSSSSRSRSPKKQPQSPIKQSLPPKQIKVNKYAFGSMLFEHSRINDRMDKQEVAKADSKLKQVDKSGRSAVLMSAAINIVDAPKEDYVIELIDGQYTKVPKPYMCSFNNCGLRFKTPNELTRHLDEHNKTQQQKNNQRAAQFLEYL